MDNFNLSKYLKNNPLLKQKGRVNESIGGYRDIKPSKNMFEMYDGENPPDYWEDYKNDFDQEFTYDGDDVDELIDYAEQELSLDIVKIIDPENPNKYGIKKVLDWDNVESLFDMYGIEDHIFRPSEDDKGRKKIIRP